MGMTVTNWVKVLLLLLLVVTIDQSSSFYARPSNQSPLSYCLPKARRGPLFRRLFIPRGMSSSTSNFPEAQTSSTKNEGQNGDLLLSCKSKLQNQNVVQLILASQSPRRREIFDYMGLAGLYSAQPSPLDESALQVRLRDEAVQTGKELSPPEYTQTLAEEKAKALALTIIDSTTTYNKVIILGSDTIVELEGKILEKPKSKDEALEMLSRLSGGDHQVHTGVALFLVSLPSSSGNSDVRLFDSFVDTAHVTFAKLAQEDIQAYVDSGEPMDKAGAYGIQGIGGQLVTSIRGDFFTVMGLPMHRTSQMIARALLSTS